MTAELWLSLFTPKPNDSGAEAQPFYGQIQKTAELWLSLFTAKPDDSGAVAQPVYAQST
jgi:hypothetical protein